MKQTLSSLDTLVKEGKVLEAFDKYFSDDVITYDESGNKTSSKAEKKALLEGFFNEFKTINDIQLFDSFVTDDTSYSNFRFVFTKDSGDKFQWDEVIIRKWKDNLVVSEFYSNQDFNTLKKDLVKPATKKASAPKKATVATKTTETKAVAKTPVKKETAVKKEVAPKATVKKEVASKKATTKKA